MKRITGWIAPLALIATPWVALAQTSPFTSASSGGVGTATTTTAVGTSTGFTLPNDTAVIVPTAPEPEFDSFEATLGLGAPTDFNSFAARLGIGTSAAATLPALTSLMGSATTGTDSTLGTTSSPAIGTTLSTGSLTSTTPTIGTATSTPSSVPAIGTSAQSIGIAAVPISVTPASLLFRVQSVPPMGGATSSSGGGAVPAAAVSARGATVLDEPCLPEEPGCIELR